MPFVAGLVLHPGEQVLETFRANRSQGWRAVGGRLVLTDRRLVFVPHAVERATGGKVWEQPLTSMTTVSLAARGWGPLDGSLRRRVMVASGDERSYFVVGKASDVIAKVQAALPS
jgi:hypothetical protein